MRPSLRDAAYSRRGVADTAGLREDLLEAGNAEALVQGAIDPMEAGFLLLQAWRFKQRLAADLAPAAEDLHDVCGALRLC